MPSQHVLTFPIYVPRIFCLLKNWQLYFKNYLLRRFVPAEYFFRNGLRLVDPVGTLTGTIAVVFIRHEYGDVRNCKVIVDVGANMGSFAVFAATQSPGAKVYCYEPEPKNFAALSNNVSINSLNDRIVLNQAAVAAKVESREMVFGESPLNSLIPGFTEGVRKMVDCTTLRKIFELHRLDHVDLLKVNCEGAEYEIFAGCTAEDLEHVSNIRVEYHNLPSPNQNGEWLANCLITRGFKIKRFTRYKDVSGFIWAGR